MNEIVSTDPYPPTVLVVTPMPVFPVSAGNRVRLNATCEALHRGGFAVDLAYIQHEDQIYRRFGQHPPTDISAIVSKFQRTFLIPVEKLISLKTWCGGFPIDSWCPDEAISFVSWYFATYPETCAIIVNYVFLSRCLEFVPAGVQRIIDTHDRFSDRHLQYLPFRSEPNFFYTDKVSETTGLARADTVLAIQLQEADYFKTLVAADVRLLPPILTQPFFLKSPRWIKSLGFIGHGNDPNLFSISKFAHAWSDSWKEEFPTLFIAGEICNSLENFSLRGVRLVGYVDRVETFYEQMDIIVAPMLMGSGLKMKVAEALSMGMPVIGTRIAFEGFATRTHFHQLTGVEDCVSTLLSIYNNAESLDELTRECADLLNRYNTHSLECEAAWLATIPRRSGARPAPRISNEKTENEAIVCGSVLLTCETSLRSLTTNDPEIGILVATEKPPLHTLHDRGFTPERKRWFARLLRKNESSEDQPTTRKFLGDAGLTLSPEWVRKRVLSRTSRECIAGYFSEMPANWSSEAKLIGSNCNFTEAVAMVPSFLIKSPSPAAVFVFDALGDVHEMQLSKISPLSRPLKLRFEETGSLTPVPSAVTLLPIIDSHHATVNELPLKQILILTDDLVGRLIFLL
ncbi:glycosyltransferase [Methylobacterium dankookense]|nr:glycosyltransferase [Methylobacterium dankookense]